MVQQSLGQKQVQAAKGGGRGALPLTYALPASMHVSVLTCLIVGKDSRTMGCPFVHAVLPAGRGKAGGAAPRPRQPSSNRLGSVHDNGALKGQLMLQPSAYTHAQSELPGP